MIRLAALGFWFAVIAAAQTQIRPGLSNVVVGGFCSDKPHSFSVGLPEGNYDVKVTFGDPKGTSSSTLRVESRRLIFERVETAPGKLETRTFTVNIRNSRIGDAGSVRLKPREIGKLNWDNQLSFEFTGSRPCVTGIDIAPARTAVTVFLAGDSTVVDQDDEPYAAWGQMLPRFFKRGLAIANHAESGESLRSSLAAKRLDKVLSLIKPGDYLFIQYGHNDEKEKGEGVGAFTTYKADLKKFVDGARQRGGIPVLITPVQRRSFDKDGRITNSHGDYPEAVRQLARAERVPLIDLNAMSKPLYEAWGVEPSRKAFAPNDNTHHNNYGSYEIAKCIVEGIWAKKLGIVKYLMNDTPRFDPSRPDPIDGFKVPASPLVDVTKPPGS